MWRRLPCWAALAAILAGLVFLSPEKAPASLLAAAALTLVYLGLCRDRAERRLERELRQIAEHLPDVVFRFDRQSRCSFMSPSVERLTGLPVEAFLGKRLGEVGVLGPAAHRIAEMLRRVYETRRPVQFRFTSKLAQGAREVDVILTPETARNGSLESVLGVGRDVTETRQAEMRAKLLQTVARTVAEAPDYPSALEGVLAAFCQAMGWSIGEVWVPASDGKTLRYDRVWSDDPARFEDFVRAGENIRHVIGHGLPGKAWEKREPVWLDEIAPGPGFPRAEVAMASGIRSACAVPVFAGEEVLLVMTFGTLEATSWRNDPVVGVIEAAARQIGTYVLRKRAEDERERLRGQFLEAQKMEAVGRLAGGVAHDFANILSAVVGTSELTLSDLAPGAPCYEDLKLIKDCALHGVSLIRQLLAVGGGRTEHGETCRLNEVLAEMRQMLGRVLGEDIRLEFRLGGSLWKVPSSKGSLEQVIMNLSVNARDAMPNGGVLTIETENLVLDSKALTMGLAPGEYVRLSVSDTGVGMSAKTRERLFQPFYTTKAPGTGTGLGLATVHQIVTLAGGRVEVQSELGKGTSFTIYFPRAGETAEAPTPPSEPSAEADWRHGTEVLLLVEDDAVVRGIAAQVLKRAGYTVLEASDGEGALRLARERVGKVRLLLTDLQLPGMNGFELAREFGRLYPGAATAYISGFTSGEKAPGSMDGSTIIPKPFTMEGLLKGVRGALDQPVRLAK